MSMVYYYLKCHKTVNNKKHIKWVLRSVPAIEGHIDMKLLPVGSSVVDSTCSFSSTLLMAPFQTCGVNDCSIVYWSWDASC